MYELISCMQIFNCYRGSVTTRVVWSILIMVFVFVMTVVLAMTDSSEWPGTFFWVTMSSVVVLNSKIIPNSLITFLSFVQDS